MEQLRVWNFSKSEEIPNFSVETIAQFSTCLRTLFFDVQEIPELGAATFSGREAYQFLIQVLCGLESPVFGETEVFGQFKNQMESFPSQHRALVQTLLTDVKTIRTKHLKGLGGSSYGSLAREYFGKSKFLLLIGAGHLAQEIYPWLAKSGQNIVIGVRTLRPFGQSLQAKTEVRLLQELKNIECDLVLAAPLMNDEIMRWMRGNEILVNKCLDFRSAQQSQGISFGRNSMDLPAIFATIQKNREDHTLVRAAAIADIRSMIDQRMNQTSLRPFGWEDLCV